MALTRLRYLGAAQHFKTAASRMPSGHEDKRLAYLEQEAGALYQQGYEFGDNRAASMTIERHHQLLAMTPRDGFRWNGPDPKQSWHRTHNLGHARAERSSWRKPSRPSGRPRGMDPGAHAARLGQDPEQPGGCTYECWQREAGRSAGAGLDAFRIPPGMDPRAHPARLGHDPKQPRRRACVRWPREVGTERWSRLRELPDLALGIHP